LTIWHCNLSAELTQYALNSACLEEKKGPQSKTNYKQNHRNQNSLQ